MHVNTCDKLAKTTLFLSIVKRCKNKLKYTAHANHIVFEFEISKRRTPSRLTSSYHSRNNSYKTTEDFKRHTLIDTK